MPDRANLAAKLPQFADHYNPRIVARYNGNEVRETGPNAGINPSHPTRAALEAI